MNSTPTSKTLNDLFNGYLVSMPRERAHLLETALLESRRLDASLYLVGGPVRDLILQRSSVDVDLVTEGDAAPVARSIADAVNGQLMVHRRFGTATVHANGSRLDLATARREEYKCPGALPSVSMAAIEEDLLRRDFTVNAMALGLSGRHADRLLDPADGYGDLSKGIIRILHPRSFEDDATRIFRAVRYEQRLGFRIESDTLEWLKGALGANMFATVSADRLRREMELILREESPVQTLMKAGQLGVLSSLYSPLKEGGWLSPFLEKEEKPQLLDLLAALAYPMNFQEAQGFSARLNMSSEWSDTVSDMNKLTTAVPLLEDPELLPSMAFRIMKGCSLASIRSLMRLTPSPVVTRRAAHFLEHQRFVRPMLRGRQLVELGVPHGPKVGEVLDMIQDARLNGEIATREDEDAFVLRCLHSLKAGVS